MLKVECESCKAPYQVDERRVPASGLKMRCPKCGHSFVVNPKGGTAPVAGAAPAGGAPAAPPPPPAQPRAPTMVGMGNLDLPAVKPNAPRPGAAPAAPMGGGGGGFGDLDLPAIPSSGGADLPSPAQRGRPGPPGFGADLPATRGAPPPPRPGGAGGFGGGGFGELDLPAIPNAAPGLPSAKGGGGGGGFGELDLPALGGNNPGLPTARGGGGFGELDLPALGGGGGNLPAAMNNLPAPMDGGLPMAASSLPMPAGGLPMAAGSLPMTAGSLPMTAGGLPMTQGSLPMAHGSLPMTQGALPSLQGDLPAPQNDLPQSIASLFDNPAPGPAGGGGGGGLVNFGEFEPGEASLSTSAGNTAAAHAAAAAAMGGGGGYGEVDLGGGSDGPAVPMAPPAAISGAVMDDGPGEAKLDQGKSAPLRPRAAPRRRGGGSMLLKVGFGFAALVILGGFGMTFTPAGAFGTTYIQDITSSAKYKKEAADAGVAARQKLANDGYQSAVAAADELFKKHDASPRNRPLAAYAAFVELASEARFGVDPARGAKAKGFLFDIPPQTDIPYLLAAQAAQELNSGDIGRARTHLTQASVHDAADPIVQEIAQLQGELELQANDGSAALAAFQKAQAKGASARSLFGIARANYMLGKQDDARKGVDQVLSQQSTHAGARILLATMKGRTDHDMDGALKDLAMVLDGAGRVNASPKERAQALAQKGWVMLAKEHPGDARAAFDEAVKIDPKNVTALLGQGELFYADGRNMEAATRFDEAVAKDPLNADALIGSAKTKIALERYNDAKAQLTAALKTFPKDMRVPLWLGVSEEKLGNRQAAEQLYDKSITLADPKHPDAVTAYALLAQMLAAQGRTQEASAKLDAAKGKLPDSSALQRALAEVAVAQGKFDDAVQHYQAAIDKDPTDVSAHFKLGVAYRKMRKLDLATQEFDKVAVADKDFPGLTLERGQLFEDAGEADKALAQFKAAFDKAPQELDLKLRMGAAYVALNDLDNGMKFLKEVLDARPNSAEAKHYLGRAYMKRGGRDIETALNYFQQATSLDSNREVYWMYVAWAANSTSPVQSGLAQTAVDKALALNKQYGDAFWQRGIIEYHSQAHKDALRDLRRALELNPGRVEVHAVMAQVYEALNDTNNAFVEWERAIKADKSQFDWDFDYGSLLWERNKIGEAASMLGVACTVGDQMAVRPGRLHTAHYLYAKALQKTGKKADAIENYKTFINTAPQGDPDRKDAQKQFNDLGGKMDQ